MILTPLQKLYNNVDDLGKIIVAPSFEWLPKVQKIAQSGHTAGDRPVYGVPIEMRRIYASTERAKQLQSVSRFLEIQKRRLS